jgi:hypothetical protein
MADDPRTPLLTVQKPNDNNRWRRDGGFVSVAGFNRCGRFLGNGLS